jgi:hypothetical protein
VQRRMKNKMSRDRKRRLDKIGFVWRAHSKVWTIGAK